MPVDHWFFYRITDNADKETEDAINHIGINDWHLATIDQWVGPMYSTTGVYGQTSSWHLAYTPSSIPVPALRAAMVSMSTQGGDGMSVDPVQAVTYAPPSAPVQLTMGMADESDDVANDDVPMSSAPCCPWVRPRTITDESPKRPLMG